MSRCWCFSHRHECPFRANVVSAEEKEGPTADETDRCGYGRGVRHSERDGVGLRHDRGGALLPVHPQPLQPAGRQGGRKVRLSKNCGAETKEWQADRTRTQTNVFKNGQIWPLKVELCCIELMCILCYFPLGIDEACLCSCCHKQRFPIRKTRAVSLSTCAEHHRSIVKAPASFLPLFLVIFSLLLPMCSYALPTKSTEVLLMQEQGTKTFVDAVLRTHERVVQVKLGLCFEPLSHLHCGL